MSLLKPRNRPPATIVFSFGCPRSGTTYVERLLEQGVGFMPFKIHEGITTHPCNSSNGLLQLLFLFRHENLIFVRSKRSATGIFQSFYAAREIAEREGKVEALARNTDERIFQFIENEHINFNHQANTVTTIGSNPPIDFRMRVVEMDFDRMDSPPYQYKFVAEFCAMLRVKQAENRAALLEYVRQTWGKKPVRVGSLSTGITGKLPDKLLSEIARRGLL